MVHIGPVKNPNTEAITEAVPLCSSALIICLSFFRVLIQVPGGILIGFNSPAGTHKSRPGTREISSAIIIDPRIFSSSHRMEVYVAESIPDKYADLFKKP